METTEDFFIFRLFIYEKGDHLYLASHEKTHEMALCPVSIFTCVVSVEDR